MPPVEVPRLTILANGTILWTATDALTVTTVSTTHDEDFLLTIEVVDSDGSHVGVQGVDSLGLVDTGEVDETSTINVGADVSRVRVRLPLHQVIVGLRIGLDSSDDDVAQICAQLCRGLESVIFTVMALASNVSVSMARFSHTVPLFVDQ